MKLARVVSVLLFLLPGGVSMAQERGIPTWVDSLLEEQGRAYEEARERILGRQDLVDVVRATLERTVYGPSTWRQLVLAEALAMHVTHQVEAEELRNLQGLNRSHYRLRRNPEPSATRELRRLRHMAPLMIELFLKGMETYEWSSPDTAEAEAAALRRGLLTAVGESLHPASVHFLADLVEGGCVCCESCDVAIRALGETGALQALPVLLRVLDEARVDGDADRVVAVVTALGSVRHVEVWPHIEVELSSSDRRVAEAAIRSAAVYGSRRYWKSDPAQGAGVRAAIGSSLLDVLVEAEDEGLVVAVLESLSSVATPQLRDLLERRRPAASDAARSVSSRATAGDRLRRAAERVDRVLVRQQRRERAR